ncbi:MAG: hypothetical protein JRE58_03780 [Deltaproteobacteria bacterium]|nr:hypothetical protein [Deltaproteobacteria bacterium]
MTVSRDKAQLIWGIVLALTGVGVFFRIPQVMPRIEQIPHFSSVTIFIRFCFYLMGVMLIGGGIKKIFIFLKASGDK